MSMGRTQRKSRTPVVRTWRASASNHGNASSSGRFHAWTATVWSMFARKCQSASSASGETANRSRTATTFSV